MNFSNETVDAIAKRVESAMRRVMLDNEYNCLKAALSSLTLADLMQVDGAIVTEAVSLSFENELPEITLQAPQGTSFFAGKYILIPFTEPKQ